MGQKSELTELTEALAEAMWEMHKTLVEEWGKIPFMSEKVSKAEYKQRFAAMTPQQKQAEIQRVGLPNILKLLEEDGEV